MYPEAAAARLRDPALHCSSVLVLLLDNFGMEVLEWEPESIQLELKDTLKVVETPLLADKINAALALVGTDLYHKSLEAFTSINAALNLRTVAGGEFNVNSLDDIMWGVTEARLMEGPETFAKAGFSHDIARYVAAMLSAEGVTKPPSALAFAEFDAREIDQRDLTLAGDQVAAEAYWRRQEEERARLDAMAADLLKGLLAEVAGLPLRNGAPKLPPGLGGEIEPRPENKPDLVAV